MSDETYAAFNRLAAKIYGIRNEMADDFWTLRDILESVRNSAELCTEDIGFVADNLPEFGRAKYHPDFILIETYGTFGIGDSA